MLNVCHLNRRYADLLHVPTDFFNWSFFLDLFFLYSVFPVIRVRNLIISPTFWKPFSGNSSLNMRKFVRDGLQKCLTVWDDVTFYHSDV